MKMKERANVTSKGERGTNVFFGGRHHDRGERARSGEMFLQKEKEDRVAESVIRKGFCGGDRLIEWGELTHPVETKGGQYRIL